MNHFNYNQIEEKDNYTLYNKEDNDHHFSFRYPKNIRKKKILNKVLIYVALIPVIVMLITFSGHIRHHNITNDSIYNNYYTITIPHPSRSVQKESDLSYLITKSFITDNKKETIDSLKSLFELYGNLPILNFYLAMAYQDNGNYYKSITQYKKVIKTGDNPYLEESEWYITLCYIKLNKLNKTEENLQNIIIKDGFYSEKAKKIYKKLDL